MAMSTRYLEGEEGWKKVPIALGTQGFCLGEGVLRLPLGPSLGLYPCAHQVTFSEESLPKGHGDFILGYYSHHHSILIGVTEPFQVNRSDSRAKARQEVPVKCPIFWVLLWDPETSSPTALGLPTWREEVGRLAGGIAAVAGVLCRSRCLPQNRPAAAQTAPAPARRVRMTALWSCSHPSPAVPALASPRDTVAAALA